MPTLHVVIPFYNEDQTLAPCVHRVLQAPMPEAWAPALVLVDDHSNEPQRATASALVRDLGEQGRRVKLCRHDVNRGKGAAVRTGYDAVLETNPPDHDLVIIQDADLEYDPADYRHLMEPLVRGDADAVIGCRWGRAPVRGLARKVHALANRVLTGLSNAMTGYHLHDMECCYKVVAVKTMRRLRPLLSENRYGVEPQIVAALARLGVRVAEVPVSYDPRSAAEGKKIGWVDGLRALYVVARERFRPVPAEQRR